ncbi:Retinoic acid induced 16-like protein-domain-containing protein [Suillus paluster]|uniref:Retinoic acid induced 16-like protein-domain-containing protein n=1 Tax=Suillus paluster TaxID=48578 RepID=UPI001B87C84E|nr:Retinoic acid induced 16-like protein-domain-containing protein [Suillus paluster]KAG1756798.1 Retinoic acid induced 16-like protein-domain-containing protein [Suillus paluster]
MDYFSKFLRPTPQPQPKPIQDHAAEFSKSWNLIKTILEHPDERQLTKGINSTDAPAHLQSMVNALVNESSRPEEGATGACLEFLLKNDVLGTLVRLAEPDRPSGIQAEVLRAVQNMVVLMDEQFLVHSAVHRAVLRLLRNCVGDDIQEQLDGRNRVMGAAKNAVRSQPSDYELDLLNLLCILCSRILTYRDLLMIFFHDKHWYRSEPLFAVEEEDEDEDEDEDEAEDKAKDKNDDGETAERESSPTPSQATITSAPASSHIQKTEYEFLLFNYLLRFVHREGQIGDFARAGLLFLMDVAMSPGEPTHRLAGDEQGSVPASASETTAGDPITDAALALAEYIVDGDFSDVLGAGLGAVYSLLPSKLEIKSPTLADASHGSGMVLGSTGTETEEEKENAELLVEKNRAIGLEDSSNPDFKSRLDHFLKLLEFLQDILRRNTIRDPPESSLDASALVGTSIMHSILDAVRRIFLENVLYPSILECSDLDGSAVAVMSYIDIMIRTLEPGQLSALLVEFLMSEDNDDTSRLRPHSRMLNLSTPPRAADRGPKLRRRKSSAMVLLEMEAPESQRQSEYFTSMGRFTLKDLLLSNLRSKNQATVAAALQLFQTMLSQRCHVSINGLFLVIHDTNATSYPEPAMIFPDVPQIPDEDSDEEEFIYPGGEDSKLSARPAPPTFIQPDVTFSTHEREMGLYLTLVSRVDPSHSDDAFSTGYDHYLRDAVTSIQNHSCFHIHDDEDMDARSKFKHRLNVNDPILSLVLESMRTFFSNSPKMNISLTGVLAELAICPNRSIAGWLTCAVSEALASFSDLDADDGRDDRSIDSVIDEKFATETNILPAVRLDEQTRPVVHTIFQGLVGQLERYRQSVENFDQYLLERRQGLLFSENLTDALTLSLEPVQDTVLPPSGSWDVVHTPDTPPQRPKPKPKTSALVSFLTPRKSKSTASKASSEPTTPPRTNSKNAAASPFAPHYQRTRDIVVEPFVAPVPQSGAWTSAQPSKWNADEDDVFSAGSQWGGHTVAPPEGGNSTEEKATQVTLSQLLDNVVVLEECIKELVAIIHARRSLGIDLVRYV